MIERFLILKETIRITFVSLDVPRIEMLTEEEWCVAEELCNLLRPLEEATREMSAENYVTASKIIPISTGPISAVADYPLGRIGSCLRPGMRGGP